MKFPDIENIPFGILKKNKSNNKMLLLLFELNYNKQTD